MHVRAPGDTRHRVLFADRSRAARIAARLPERFELVPLGPESPIPAAAPAVLLVDFPPADPARLEHLPPAQPESLAIVALLAPDAEIAEVPGHWYACLPSSAPVAALARTLDNAFAHMATRE